MLPLRYEPKKNYESAIINKDGKISDEAFHAEVPEHEALGRSAVRERQIDFLLQEEFASNPDFLNQFLHLCKLPMGADHGPAVVLEALSSVRDQKGETDVLISYRRDNDPPNTRRGLLIEDKIDALFGKRQAERYTERGELGFATKRWSSYLTCLVAPRAYIHANHGFRYAVALEDISNVIAPDSPARREYKQRVITYAIAEQARQGLKEEDPVVTDFRLRYFQAYQRFWSTLEATSKSLLEDVIPPKPQRAWWDDTWFEFRGPGLGKHVYINHKAGPGFVDLTFKYTKAEVLAAAVQLEPGMQIQQTGKSAAMRIKVPPIDCHADFNVQLPSLTTAFEALLRLVAFFKVHPALRPPD